MDQQNYNNYNNYNYNYNQPYQPQIGPQPNTLVFGILSLAVCGFFGILGIIFGAIGRSKGKNYVLQGGTLTGASKVGFILSLVGLILGIVTLVVCVVVIVIALTSDTMDLLDALKEIAS